MVNPDYASALVARLLGFVFGLVAIGFGIGALANARGRAGKVFAAIAGTYAGKEQVIHFEEGLNPGQVRELADAIAEKAGTAVVYSGTDEAGYSICILSKTADTRVLGKALNTKLNGRGGRKPGAFQGSVQATRAAIEEFFSQPL